MDAVRAEIGLEPQQLWAKVSDISEGRGGERAIGAVTFFTGAASAAPSATGTQLSATPQWRMLQCGPSLLQNPACCVLRCIICAIRPWPMQCSSCDNCCRRRG